MENLITPFATVLMMVLSIAMIYIPVKINMILERRQLVRDQRRCARALSDGRQFSGYHAIPTVDCCEVEEKLAEINAKLASPKPINVWRIL